MDGQPYARDSYGEIGEWRGRMMYDRTAHFVIGAEAQFPGLNVISQNFRSAIGELFMVHSSLAETVGEAIQRSGARYFKPFLLVFKGYTQSRVELFVDYDNTTE
jgi:hypothetical protein